MATQSQILRKEQVVSGLVETRQKLLTEISSLPNEQSDQVFLGIWSVKDLLAHLIGWDFTNLEAVLSVQQEQVPAFYEYHNHEWRTYNAMLVKKYKKNSVRELLTRARTSHEKLIKLLQTIPPGNFNKDFGVRFRGYKVTIQRLLETEMQDEQTHLQQIIDFFGKSK